MPWPISTRVNKPENDDPSIVRRSNWPSPPRKQRAYGFGETQVGALTLLILTLLSGSPSGGVVIANFSGHAVTFRRSPTVFAETSMSGSTSTRILSGKLPSAS